MQSWHVLVAETLVVLATPVLILATLVSGYLLIPIEDGNISQASCDRIQIGMSRAKLHELLDKHARRGTVRVTESCWGDEEGNEIIVNFDLEGRVTKKRFVPTQLSFIELMKRRIQLRVRALWP
jgi:hypothetical protein